MSYCKMRKRRIINFNSFGFGKLYLLSNWHPNCMKRMVMIWVISLGAAGSVAKSDDIFRQGWNSIHDGQNVKLQLQMSRLRKEQAHEFRIIECLSNISISTQTGNQHFGLGLSTGDDGSLNASGSSTFWTTDYQSDSLNCHWSPIKSKSGFWVLTWFWGLNQACPVYYMFALSLPLLLYMNTLFS